MPEALLNQFRWDVDAIWVPEMEITLEDEIERLNEKMNEHDSVNIFLSEGAGLANIIAELKADGKEPAKDAFGHYRLDDVNVGNWFSSELKDKLGAEKVLVQKSGYFARSAAPNREDLELIKRSASHAAESAMREESGVAGLDEENGGMMGTIAFPRIKGGKPFDINETWFTKTLEEIGQPKGKRIESH